MCIFCCVRNGICPPFSKRAIGSFFDDPAHEVMGLKDAAFQSLYHFTVGGPLEDTRLETQSAYHHLSTIERPPNSKLGA